MENTPLKFRQPVFINGKFNRWHYWGFISDKDEFAGITAPFHVAKKSQQYIGQADIDGKELYAGDIVKRCGAFDDILLIEYDKNTVSFIFVGEDNTKSWINMKGSLDKNIKLIGNTTENPELLRSD